MISCTTVNLHSTQLHEIDEAFLEFLENKIKYTIDMDERVGLGSLRGTISSVLQRVRVAEQEALEASVPAAQEELSMEQVQQRMREVQMGRELEAKALAPGAATVFKEFQVKSNRRDTFLDVLERLQGLPEEVTLEAVVRGNYELCDKDFMEQLMAEICDCEQQGAEVEAELYQAVLDAVHSVMAAQMASAQERLQEVLSKGSPAAMESTLAVMARKGPRWTRRCSF